MSRILVAEPVAQAGVDILAAEHETSVRLNLPRAALLSALAEEGGWDALVVRSQTRVDAELLAAAAPRLSVVGVASVGTDRVDLPAATRGGVMVVNAPTGNTIAAAEHTMALMLALLRQIPGADASVRRGEWERAKFIGAELRQRTLGIIGLGKIGKAVARRAAAFEMRVLAHDPFMTAEQADENAARLVGLPELLVRADVITVHVPLTAQTRGLIGEAQIGAMKPGAVLLNVARGGLVDEAALARALSEGRLAGAAIDVFSAEPMAADNPLRDAPNTILTPHLGASTSEAQGRVGVEMAEQLVMALSGVVPPYALNAPSVAREVAPSLHPYVELGRRLALLARQLAPAPFEALTLTYAGEISAWDGGPIRTAVLAGLLESSADLRVNAVNADVVARERGLTVTEERTDAADPFASLVILEVGEGPNRVVLSGSSAHGRAHLAGLDGFAIDAELAGTILVTRHRDQPGIVGAVGSALAAAGVNISSLELSRLSVAGEAMMFVSVDQAISAEMLDALRSVPGMIHAQVVELPRLSPEEHRPIIRGVSGRPFASSADLAEKTATLEELAPGVYAYTAQGDPNVGCIVGTDAVLAIEARATPVMAQRWIDVIRTLTDLPFGDLVLTHYHAVRVLGASAFHARRIIAHRNTAAWIEERGAQDWASEAGRMPRLFEGAETIPGLTRPTDTFDDRLVIDLGNRLVELRYLGRGHTAGDIVVWLPDERICFGGDLVEAQAAPYMGDAHIGDWRGETLAAVAALGARQLVGGRGPVVRDDAVALAIDDTRAFLSAVLDGTQAVRDGGGTPAEAYRSTRAELEPRYGTFPIFEHTMPFNVQRAWDELGGIDHPRIWTVDRDREVWDALTG